MRDIIGLIGGGIMEVHDPAACAGQACCVHNPSDHPLNTAPLDWWPIVRIMVRVCEHTVPHPDPDDIRVRTMARFFSHHLCDGCCGGVPIHDLRRLRETP